MALFGLGLSRGKSGGLMNVIRCDEEEYLVWKWRPLGQETNTTSRENSIRYGSRLRVKEGEVAVFVYKQQDGSVQDFIVGPYDDTIKTANFPVLSDIMGLAFGGDSPFQAEIYFINLQSNNQIKFSIPYFDVSDPRLPDFPVPVAVRGSLTFALEDYKNFIKLNRLVNFDLTSFRSQIQEAMTRKIKSVITNVPTDLSMPAIQMERKIDQISDVLGDRLKERLEEFGVKLKYIDVSDIEIDKESVGYMELKNLTGGLTAQTLQAQTSLNIKNMQDVQAMNVENSAELLRIQREEAQRIQKLQTESNFLGTHALNQQASVLQSAASGLSQMGNMGSSGGMNPAGMMVGMTLGGALGGQMAGMLGSVAQQAQQPMSPPPPPTTQYMISNNGNQLGPYTIPQMEQMVQNGSLTKDTYVWKSGMNQWELAGNVSELASIFTQTPPPPPGMPTPPSV